MSPHAWFLLASVLLLGVVGGWMLRGRMCAICSPPAPAEDYVEGWNAGYRAGRPSRSPHPLLHRMSDVDSEDFTASLPTAEEK